MAKVSGAGFAAGLLSCFLGTSLWAAIDVTLEDLKEHPKELWGQTVSLECYYDKESPIWVRALPDPDRWIGIFVSGAPEKALTWSGEYYNLVFVPRELQETVRTLRSGDKITLMGEGFHYQSASLDGVGIHVQQILQGWGSTAKPVGGDVAVAMASLPPVTTLTSVAPQKEMVPRQETPLETAPPVSAEKYTATINGKRYGGLRFGDRYNFDGVDFQVDK